MARLICSDLLVFPLYGPGYRLGSAIVVPLMDSDLLWDGNGRDARAQLYRRKRITGCRRYDSRIFGSGLVLSCIDL